MRIFKETSIELSKDVWQPLWRKTLYKSHPCPLTSSMVIRSKGIVTVPVKYKLDGRVLEEELEVHFEENSPSLSSDNSHCWGASIRISTKEWEWKELEIISIG